MKTEDRIIAILRSSPRMTYERTTECYRTFMKLVQRYVDENTKRTIREIKKETKRVRKEARDAR